MSIKKLLAVFVVFAAMSCTGLFADPVTLTMDDLDQIGELQNGNNNSLSDAIELTGITDLQWAGGFFETSYLWVWDYNNGIFWWGGEGEVTHLSIKAGNNWLFYELEAPLQSGGFIQLESEIFNKKGVAKSISHVTGYRGVGTTSVPEPAALILVGMGLLAIPGYRKFIA